MKKQTLMFTVVASLFIVNTCLASQFVTINDWTYRSDQGDVGVPLFRVTMTFTPAADLGGINNKYEYSVENLTNDLTATLFRVANPDDLPRTMNGPLGWSERTGVPNFLWEGGTLLPGQTVGIFEVLTPGLLPDLVTPPFALNGQGWIMAEDLQTNRVDVNGPIVHNPICYPDLPDPELVYLGSEDYIGSDGNDYTRYLLSVDNWPMYPEALFEAAPDLPPCDLNTDASRTWVAIYREDGTRIYGFCDLSDPEQLTGLWFGLPKGETPPECVYIVMTDRRCDNEYTSNLACIFLAVDVDIKPTSCPNPFNVKSKGVLPVAILGAEDLDVTTIDPLTITLAGVAPLRSAYEDVATPVAADAEECDCTTEGPDGFTDLTLKFDRQAIVEATLGCVSDGDVVILTLEGLTDGNIPVIGSDCVWILKKGK